MLSDTSKRNSSKWVLPDFHEGIWVFQGSKVSRELKKVHTDKTNFKSKLLILINHSLQCKTIQLINTNYVTPSERMESRGNGSIF